MCRLFSASLHFVHSYNTHFTILLCLLLIIYSCNEFYDNDWLQLLLKCTAIDCDLLCDMVGNFYFYLCARY